LSEFAAGTRAVSIKYTDCTTPKPLLCGGREEDKFMKSRSIVSASLCVVASTSLLCLLPAYGQSKRVIMMDDDSGAAPHVMHFSMPDFFELRQPDFLKRDLPTFTEKLMLSQEQAAAIERLIEKYLESLQAIAAEHLPKGGGGPMQIDLGDGADGGPTGMMILGPEDDLGELGEFIDVQGEPLDGMPRTFGIGVDMQVGGPAGEAAEGAGEGPQAGVMINLQTPDGEEMSPETRKKLEEAAAKIAEKMKERMEKQLAEGGDPADVMPLGGPISIEDMQKRHEEMAAKADAFRAAKANLRQAFVADAQTTLAVAQLERWPDLDRALRRQKTLPRGRLSGERTDLTQVFKSIEPSEIERQAVAEELAAYELTLDHALQQRNEFVPESQKKLDEAMQKGDTDKALSMIDRATALRIAVRSTNEKFTDVIALKLPEPRATEFKDAALKASYPTVYRPTYAQRLFAAARKIDGVDASVQASLAELEDAYLAELSSMNGQLRQILAKHEPNEPRRGIEHMQKVMTRQVEPGGMMDDAEEDPIRKGFDRRRELDDRYAKQVTSMLTPEQAGQLPKPRSRKPSEPVIIRMPLDSSASQ
jgi:hypothetical protein